MARPPPPRSLEEMDVSAFTPVLRALRTCLHLLVAVLLVVAVIAAVPRGHVVPVAVAAGVFAGAYAVGPRVARLARPRHADRWWLLVLAASWLALLGLSPEATWLAFPLFVVELHTLPRVAGIATVAATAAAAVAGYSAHRGALSLGTVLGPTLGAAVTVGMVLGYQALHRESEARRKLIAELVDTRAELVASERRAGVLAERERLAREIHDTLAQGLSSIQLLLRAAERVLPGDPEAAVPHVRQARVTATDNLAEARRFVRALAPPSLDGASLESALARLCARSAEESGVAVRFHRTGDVFPLETAHQAALLRIAQSALANTIAHAKAERAEVTLSYMDASVTLDIVDDGVGFDPAALGARPADGSGYGLITMRARAEELGGRVEVESAPGQGTAIAAAFPLAAARADAGKTGAPAEAGSHDHEAAAPAPAPIPEQTP